jgi:hypothetical protein
VNSPQRAPSLKINPLATFLVNASIYGIYKRRQKMKTSLLILAAAVGLAMIAVGAQGENLAPDSLCADSEDDYLQALVICKERDREAFHQMISQKRAFLAGPIQIDDLGEEGNFGLHAIRIFGSLDIVYTLPRNIVHSQPSPKDAASVETVATPIPVVEPPSVATSATPVHKAVSQDAGAEYRKNIKSGKWHEFKNGE